MKAGAMDFTERPIGHDELLARVDRVLCLALIGWRYRPGARRR
jgi:FixJ family two-component response regulator